MTIFDDVFGNRLHLDPAHRAHILAAHPEIRPYLGRLADVFKAPEWVKRSRRDPSIYLYYRFYADAVDGKYLLGVAKITSRSVVLTCYVTDTIKQGDLLWPAR